MEALLDVVNDIPVKTFNLKKFRYIDSLIKLDTLKDLKRITFESPSQSQVGITKNFEINQLMFERNKNIGVDYYLLAKETYDKNKKDTFFETQFVVVE